MHDQLRGSAAARGYGRSWQAIRAEHLAFEPYCRCGCGGLATDVDHILPRALGGTDDHANLQSLTHGHHSRKTAMRDGGFGRGVEAWRRGADAKAADVGRSGEVGA